MENSRVTLAFCSLLFTLPGSAQVALKSDTPSLLFWTPEQQSAGYRSIEKQYPSSDRPVHTSMYSADIG
jgi:hypothetical protein